MSDKKLAERAIRQAIPLLLVAIRAIQRRKSIAKTKKESRPTTPALRKRIVAFKAANPTMSQRKIAQRFNINTGRVSEALNPK